MAAFFTESRRTEPGCNHTIKRRLIHRWLAFVRGVPFRGQGHVVGVVRKVGSVVLTEEISCLWDDEPIWVE
jgi:hypothetical protein